MKQTTRTFILAALLVAIVPSCWAASGSLKNWTILVYMSADNNLAVAGLDDINEMEMVGSTEHINVVVQIDGSSEFSPTAADTRRYFIEKDDDPKTITSPVLESLGELDSGSPKTLEKFLSWGIANYPAQRYALIVWNHGNGWYPDSGLHRFRARRGPLDPLKAIATDDESGTAISTTAIGDVMTRVSAKLRSKIDLIGFDACLMGMAEIFWEIKDVTEVAIGSEKTEPGDGWPYDEWLSILAAHPDFNSEDLARTIVETYAASYHGGSAGTSNVTLSAVRFTEPAIANFEGALDLFTTELLAGIEKHRDVYLGCAAAAQDFQVRSWFGSYFTSHRDLYDFALRIKGALPEERDLGAACNLLMESIDGPLGLVFANGTTEVSNHGSVEGAHGLAIYLPTTGYENTYRELDFAETGWFKFVHELNQGKIIDGPAESHEVRTASREALFGNLYDD